MIAGSKGESIEEKDDIDKEIALLKQKVENTGNKFGVQKSKEAIMNVLDNGLKSFLLSIAEQGEKFKTFYRNYHINISIDNHSRRIATSDLAITTIETLSSHINDNCPQLYLQCEYLVFSKRGFGDCDYKNHVMVTFKDFGYSISTSPDKKVLTKKYNEFIEPDEAKNILESLKTHHLNLINSTLSKYDNKQ